jgi:hypothetical protein
MHARKVRFAQHGDWTKTKARAPAHSASHCPNSGASQDAVFFTPWTPLIHQNHFFPVRCCAPTDGALGSSGTETVAIRWGFSSRHAVCFGCKLCPVSRSWSRVIRERTPRSPGRRDRFDKVNTILPGYYTPSMLRSKRDMIIVASTLLGLSAYELFNKH